MEFFCTICHETFGSSNEIYGTTCGHVFHHRCISGWLDKSTSCPECRCACSVSALIKIFLSSRTKDSEDVSNNETDATLKTQLEESRRKLNETLVSFKRCQPNLNKLQDKLFEVELDRKRIERELCSSKWSAESLQEDLSKVYDELREAKNAYPQEYGKKLEKIGLYVACDRNSQLYVRLNGNKCHINSKERIDCILRDFKGTHI